MPPHSRASSEPLLDRASILRASGPCQAHQSLWTVPSSEPLLDRSASFKPPPYWPALLRASTRLGRPQSLWTGPASSEPQRQDPVPATRGRARTTEVLHATPQARPGLTLDSRPRWTLV
ncbi:unnamed protein product [Boreogadus saida]